MRNIWLVLKHDIAVTLRQKSFWLMTFLMPAFLIGLNAFYAIQDSDRFGTSSQEEAASSSQPTETLALGLVDESGLLAKMPPDLPAGLLVPFADEADARSALEAGKIEQYVYIPPDYIATGQITVYDKDFQIMLGGANPGVAFGGTHEHLLDYLIAYNLAGNEQVAVALQDPTPGNLAAYHALNPPQGSGEGQALAGVVSTVVPYIFYFLLLIGSSYLMQSVVAEKQNRTAEVLLLSLPPRQMMLGKILAMTAIILIQLAVWVGGGSFILNRGAALLNLEAFTFPPGFVVWATLFLILGYLLYASLMAAAGAIANNPREAGQMTWLLILPLMPTLMFASMFVEDPNNPLVLVLSLFPFSAPSAMVTRLAVTTVPLWQVLISLVGVALTAYLFVSLSARFFQAGNLLSSTPFSWRRLLNGWRS
jgi:ABC-2 type transport system permease protein